MPPSRRRPARGADPDQLLRTQPEQLLGYDGERRRAHSRCLDAHRSSVEGAGVAEHSPMRTHLAGVLQAAIESLGDLRGAVRVAGEEDDGGIVADLGAEVDLWHDR